MSDMINEEEKIGKISIADGVVASIAGIAEISRRSLLQSLVRRILPTV